MRRCAAITNPVCLTLFDLFCLAIITAPVFILLIPSGYLYAHDSMDPPWRSLELNLALSQGVLFPRWAPDLFCGYGFPLFNYYSALSFYPAAILKAILPVDLLDGSKMAFGSYLLLSAVGTYVLGREVLQHRGAALLASVFYLYAPTTIGTAFVRGSMATSAALAILPFALALTITLCRKSSYILSGVTAFLIAVLMLTHNITAMIGLVMIVVVVIWHFWRATEKKKMSFVVLALVLGIGASSFFTIPAVGELKFTHVDKLVYDDSTNFRYHFINPFGDVHSKVYELFGKENILITSWGPFDLHLAYPYGAAPYKMGLIQGLLMIAAFVAFFKTQKRPLHIESLFIATLGLFYFHTTWSQWLWEIIPAFSLIQYPWRLVGPLGLGLAVVGSWVLFSAGKGWQRTLLITLVGIAAITSSLWMLPKDLRPFEGGIDVNRETLFWWEGQNRNRIGTVLGGQFLPASVIWDEESMGFSKVIDRYGETFPREEFVGDVASVPFGGKAWVLAARKGIQWMEARVEAAEAVQVAFRLVFFPGWTAYLDGEKVPINYSNWYEYEEGRRAALGVCLVDVPQGTHTLKLIFEDTPIRLWSNRLSLASLLGIGLLFLADFYNRKSKYWDQKQWAALLISGLAIVVGICLGYQYLVSSKTPDWIEHRTVRDLLEEVSNHKLQLNVPSGAKADEYVQPKYFSIGGEALPVLYMHPTSSASTHVWLPESAKLEFALGIDPVVWDKAGDGVEFEVSVIDAGNKITVFKRYLNPKSNPTDRGWLWESIDLGRFAHKEVDVILTTYPGTSNEFDWAGWASPKITIH